MAEEFNELWAVDLKGNARTSGERRRQEGGNVFDDTRSASALPSIFWCVSKAPTGSRVYYNDVRSYCIKAPDKVNYIKG